MERIDPKVVCFLLYYIYFICPKNKSSFWVDTLNSVEEWSMNIFQEYQL